MIIQYQNKRINYLDKKQKINIMIKRMIMSRLYGLGHNGVKLAVNNGLPKMISRRDYPGDFRAVQHIKEGQPVRGGTGKTVPNHETYHVNLQNATSKEIIGGFTTHPKPNDPNYYKISDQKLNGDAGEQYLGVYKSPKIITGDTEIIRELPEIQPFIDKHESFLHKIEKSKKHAIREERTSKQDSRFYNEDGTRDYENFPNK